MKAAYTDMTYPAFYNMHMVQISSLWGNGRIGKYPLYEMADTVGFPVLTIFSPRADELEEVRLKLMKANYSFPVFVDVNGSFSENNGNIPFDRRFHSFLIDSCNHPVYVGNPMSSDRMFELFVRTIDML